MPEEAQTEDVQSPLTNLTDAVKNLWKDNKHADITVICAERSWRVHKVILCAQSPFFAKACDGDFKASGLDGSMEAQTGVITLKEDDPSAVAAMLGYVYNFDYPDDANVDNAEPMAPIMFNLQIFVIADKYDIPHLCRIRRTKFCQRVNEGWKDAAFAEVAALVFGDDAGAASQFRDVVVGVATEHCSELSQDDVVGARFQEVVSSVPALGLALWRKQIGVRDYPDHHWCQCPSKDCEARAFLPKLLRNENDVWCTVCASRYEAWEWQEYAE
ncbi:hypothetical protein LTR56_001063 [Elasticomyces elasticus]|nr:hypothetical protein LTR56_001063 [Elasticomyces elasticus]KAK3663464.1 hypothetical protein LTR22_005635 [Elasticomyces elasticus]KAK5768985.1 hypothetical protein LTS12_000698 [Elasticomyces elasticus]